MKRLLTLAPMTEAEAAPWVTGEELATAAGFGSAVRRAEFLTWRAAVRRELGRDVRIAYDANGAPCLPGRAERISVSHCPGRVAVVLSEGPCAVDIESETRNFGRVIARYMTPCERRLSESALWPAVAWCAKEALYKYAGRRELDLLRDLRLLEADLGEGFDPLPGVSSGVGVTAASAGTGVPGEEPVSTADGAAGKVTGSVCGGAPVTLSVLRAAGYLLVFRY